jgi:hypothetical protein
MNMLLLIIVLGGSLCSLHTTCHGACSVPQCALPHTCSFLHLIVWICCCLFCR